MEWAPRWAAVSALQIHFKAIDKTVSIALGPRKLINIKGKTKQKNVFAKLILPL